MWQEAAAMAEHYGFRPRRAPEDFWTRTAGLIKLSPAELMKHCRYCAKQRGR